MITTFTKKKSKGKAATLCAAVLALAAGLWPAKLTAQLSQNPDKFLGNITTRGSVDYGKEAFHTLWNQITPENESKWSSVEGTRNSYNWSGADRAFNYAKQHKFPYKFHTLVWGSQYPGWIERLSDSERYNAIVKWMDAVKKRYPDLPMIDVVNEAVPGHQAGTSYMKSALGGDGKTGYDWIIKAFELAYERWPNAILIYNDFNTFQWQRTEFINLVRTLRDAGAPIDAYGCQSHDLTDMDVNNFKSAVNEIQNALKMPMYITEYDIGTSNDALQEQRYKEQIPYFWEASYCAGVTLWGYIYGATWTTDGNSGIIRDGNDRPAMIWLRQYMASDKAKNAKSPFPGMVKEASIYVKPASISVTRGDVVPITVRAAMRTKTIAKVELYVNNQLKATMTEAPYTTEYTPANNGKYNLKAVVTTTDGTTYERLGAFTAYNPRAPYAGEISLPGTLQAENFDSGADGISYHDSNTNNEGTAKSYRTNGGGVDIESISGGYAIGYINDGEWLEYSVNVKEAGLYSFDAYVSSQDGGGSFSLALSTDDGLTALTGTVPVLKTGNWSTYRAMHGRTTVELKEGSQRLRFIVVKGNFNIDKLLFKRIDVDNTMAISLKASPSPATVAETTTLTATASSQNSTVANVKFYLDGVLQKTATAEPFEYAYRPTAQGTYSFTAIATDADGRQSRIASLSLKVNPKRTAYKGVKNVPGIIEAEDFDIGTEGFTYHDSDSQDEGNSGYRRDNQGVDIVKFTGGYAIGYTTQGEWLEYTVNVTRPGKFTYVATVASGLAGSAFTIALVRPVGVTSVAKVNVPNTGSWDTYTTVSGNIAMALPEGEQRLRITINNAYCNIDKIELKAVRQKGDVNDDGNFDVGDIMAIINHMAGSTDFTLDAADVNGDNTVDVGDIMAVINIMSTLGK